MAKFVGPGATLGIVSPASPVGEGELDAGLAFLHESGYRTKLFPNARAMLGFIAGTDDERAADLQAAFADPEVDAVLCSRGGYGCARLLSKLDLDALAASGKAFIGYSDITALNIALVRRGVRCIHGPMVACWNRERPDWVRTSFLAALRGEDPIVAEADRGATVVYGMAEGRLVGGCLTLLADSVGTPEAFDGAGGVVLLEDVGERPHRVDAMLTHLLNSGALDRAAGFVVGEMTGTDELGGPGLPDWCTVVIERLRPLGRPTIYGFPFGHVAGCLSLPLGAHVRLDADSGTLQILDQ